MRKTAVFAGIAAALLLYGAAVIRLAENDSMAQNSEAAKTAGYTVREYNGKIAVFSGNDDIPVKILNIDAGSLREYDKKQFETGITLDSMREVLMLEEDFSG
mgnify:CR=1 FL=1